MISRTVARGSGEADDTYMLIRETNMSRNLSTTIQIVEKKIFPLYKMKLVSLELKCESLPAFSLAASILLVFPYLPRTLVSLKLTSLPRITLLLLKEIARRCLSLRELELSVVQRLSTDCCWACFEDSSSWAEHSPVGSDASNNTAENLAVGGCPPLGPRITLIVILIDVLCWLPSTTGRAEATLHRGLHLLSDDLEGTHQQPFPCERGLLRHGMHDGRLDLCASHTHNIRPGGTSPSTFTQKISREGCRYAREYWCHRVQALHAVQVCALLGGSWAPYS
jgi:hypothetical protein